MKRRIARTIVGVTFLVIVVLGVPFAIVVQRFYESRATVELQRSAAEAIAELEIPLQADRIADAATEPDAPADFSVYDETGARLYGSGPAHLGPADPDELVVVSPVTDRSTETVVGSVRVSRDRGSIAAEARKAWGVMAIAAAGGLALAVLVARREAARLTAPITELADRAERLGHGDFEVSSSGPGIAELDTLSDALTLSGRRLAELVNREREFSANASHQLRTPLTALRASLERHDVVAAEEQAARLEATVDHMLALARNALPRAEPIQVGPVVIDAATRWRDRYSAGGRSLHVVVADPLPVARVRAGSLDQVLDVLLDNSLRHGAGATRLTVRPAPGGLVVQIDDDGEGIDPERASNLLAPSGAAGQRIGLSLARSLIEADGGRLILADHERAEFRVVLAGDAGEP